MKFIKKEYVKMCTDVQKDTNLLIHITQKHQKGQNKPAPAKNTPNQNKQRLNTTAVPKACRILQKKKQQNPTTTRKKACHKQYWEPACFAAEFDLHICEYNINVFNTIILEGYDLAIVTSYAN